MCVQKNMRDVWHRYWTETSGLGSATSAISMKFLVQGKEKSTSRLHYDSFVPL